MGQTVKRLPIMQETRVRFLGQEDPLEKEMATHSSTLAWKIPMFWSEASQALKTYKCKLGFPGGSDSKESTCNEGDLGSIPGLGRFHGGGHDNLFQFSCLENPHGQRSLAGYSPGGCKESDMTEQ